MVEPWVVLLDLFLMVIAFGWALRKWGMGKWFWLVFALDIVGFWAMGACFAVLWWLGQRIEP